MSKTFGLAAADIKSIVPGRGSCFASDRITVGNQRVGFMYRELPDNEIDSGWRFFSGGESQEYLDDPKNLEIYDVNTIANYDPDIVPYLDAPAFSAFGRHPQLKIFIPEAFPG